MAARLAELKDRVIALRKQGESYKNIHARLGIPLSTLSGWLRDVPLSKAQKAELDDHRKQGLVDARRKAVIRHNEQKATRLTEAKRQAVEVCEKIPHDDRTALEIALAFLYLGEGIKTRAGLGLGNSDPEVVRFYVSALKTLYGISYDSFGVYLHLRADQDESALKAFWSRETGVPLSRFRQVTKDKRTAGRATYDGYKGVCLITGGGVEIQRRLMYLADVFCARMRG